MMIKLILHRLRLSWWRRCNPDKWMLAIISREWVAGRMDTDTAARLIKMGGVK